MDLRGFLKITFFRSRVKGLGFSKIFSTTATIIESLIFQELEVIKLC